MISVLSRLPFTLLMICCASNLRAQSDTVHVENIIRKPTIRSTEIHVGIGFQKFIHYGIRQRIGSFLLGADLGNLTIFASSATISLEVGWIPTATLYNPGFYFGLLFSEVSTSDKLLDESGIYHRALTGNVGWVTQHKEWLSSIVKAGLGVHEEVTPPNLNLATGTQKRYLLAYSLEFEVGVAF
ncbi:MAG TPA: hypothetical protein VFO76_10230 [Candidatus Kapabacteria bacterium]|nr:hypothetical protein [Candidatus Kapabacteria bacterium]